jgi:hypothetical protein
MIPVVDRGYSSICSRCLRTKKNLSAELDDVAICVDGSMLMINWDFVYVIGRADLR